MAGQPDDEHWKIGLLCRWKLEGWDDQNHAPWQVGERFLPGRWTLRPPGPLLCSLPDPHPRPGQQVQPQKVCLHNPPHLDISKIPENILRAPRHQQHCPQAEEWRRRQGLVVGPGPSLRWRTNSFGRKIKIRRSKSSKDLETWGVARSSPEQRVQPCPRAPGRELH